MCGIFGIVSKKPIRNDYLSALAKHALQRGRDSSGLCVARDDSYSITRSDEKILGLLRRRPVGKTRFAMGHSRLITNGLADNQPVFRDGIVVIHNGIIVNDEDIWRQVSRPRLFQVDSEIIAALAADHLDDEGSVETLADAILARCKGVVSCAMAIPRLGKLVLFSNNGSLYGAELDGEFIFASESHPLKQIGALAPTQIVAPVVIDIPVGSTVDTEDIRSRSSNLLPSLGLNRQEEALLQFPQPILKRCSKCILPNTMPFIEFNESGECIYCERHSPRNSPKPKKLLFDLVEPYRNKLGDAECIVPFSGGRDSSYALHLIVNELGLKPITYTYDWGMVTDLGRRNISRMSSRLGVENIIIAADITKKRENIRKNLTAWLEDPQLGMISILTAGDKHFFKYLETVKKQTGVALNLWGVSPLETTFFKAGFLGVPPDFDGESVYINKLSKQLQYQLLRLRAMARSPKYFNSSLWDTVSGEFYRSIKKKSDYFHIFDFWEWEESQVDATLEDYEWERAPDTKTTWRIGDGTAAFYNYIYHTVAGFTEHDTFRSNQIREGQLTRAEALRLVAQENLPRYPNIKWYLDAVGLDFKTVIEKINRINKVYGGD